MFGQVPTLNERRKRMMAGRARQSDGTFFLMVMDGEGEAAFQLTLVPSGVSPLWLLM